MCVISRQQSVWTKKSWMRYKKRRNKWKEENRKTKCVKDTNKNNNNNASNIGTFFIVYLFNSSCILTKTNRKYLKRIWSLCLCACMWHTEIFPEMAMLYLAPFVQKLSILTRHIIHVHHSFALIICLFLVLCHHRLARSNWLHPHDLFSMVVIDLNRFQTES